MRFYALTKRPWVPEEECWGLPSGTIGSVDLGPGDGSGYVFVTSDFPFENIDSPIGDGTRLHTYIPNGKERRDWETLLGIPFPKNGTLLDGLWDALTIYADPDGILHAKPIIPTRNGILELHLGGHSLIRSEKIPDDPTQHRAWPVIQRVLQNDYSRIHRQNPILARKWLGAQKGKYHLSEKDTSDLLIPIELPKELPLKPTTTISDDFNRIDSADVGSTWDTILGGNWSIVSNQLQFITAGANEKRVIRTAADLSSDDHSAICDVTSITLTSQVYGPGARISSDMDGTYYVAFLRGSTSGTNLLSKVLSGSRTTIAPSLTNTFPLPASVEIVVDGSTITMNVGGVEWQTVTDTSITGNLKTGMVGHVAGSGDNSTADNFESSDLLAGEIHELTTTDTESTSEVSSPTIGQIHSLTPNNVESASEVSFPSISVSHSLETNNIESASEINTVPLGQSHTFSSTSVESAAEITTPILEQTHNFNTGGIETTSETSETAFGQKHSLQPTGIESDSDISVPLLGQKHIISTNNVEAISEVSEPSMTARDSLEINDIEASSETSSQTLGQTHVLISNSIESVSETGSPELGQEHSIATNDVQSAFEISNPALGQIHSLSLNSIESTSETSSPEVHNVHQLIINDIEAVSEVSSPVLTSATLLRLNNVESTSEVSNTSIGQIHNLIINNIEARSETSSPEFSSNHPIQARVIAGRTITVAREPRKIFVANENRMITVAAENRRIWV